MKTKGKYCDKRDDPTMCMKTKPVTTRKPTMLMKTKPVTAHNPTMLMKTKDQKKV